MTMLRGMAQKRHTPTVWSTILPQFGFRVNWIFEIFPGFPDFFIAFFA
jgi:hypothetical protein